MPDANILKMPPEVAAMPAYSQNIWNMMAKREYMTELYKETMHDYRIFVAKNPGSFDYDRPERFGNREMRPLDERDVREGTIPGLEHAEQGNGRRRLTREWENTQAEMPITFFIQRMEYFYGGYSPETPELLGGPFPHKVRPYPHMYPSPRYKYGVELYDSVLSDFRGDMDTHREILLKPLDPVSFYEADINTPVAPHRLAFRAMAYRDAARKLELYYWPNSDKDREDVFIPPDAGYSERYWHTTTDACFPDHEEYRKLSDKEKEEVQIEGRHHWRRLPFILYGRARELDEEIAEMYGMEPREFAAHIRAQVREEQRQAEHGVER